MEKQTKFYVINDDSLYLTIRYKHYHHLKKEQIFILENDKYNTYVKVSEVISNYKVIARKHTPSLYLYDNYIHAAFDLHKLGSTSWQFVEDRIEQQDGTSTAHKLDKKFEIKLDPCLSPKEVEQLEKKARLRLNIYRTDKKREWVQNPLKCCIKAMKEVVKEYDANKCVFETLAFPKRKNQIERTLLAREHYRKYDKGWYSSPPGSGKTFDSYWIYTDLLNECIIDNPNGILLIFEPSKHLIYQNSEKIRLIAASHGYPITEYKIFSDNPSEILDIIQRLKEAEIENGLSIFYCTYQSHKKLSVALLESKVVADFKFYDELHRLVGDLRNFWKSAIKDTVIPAKKQCGCSASPILYDGISDRFISLNDERFFGKQFDNYSIKEAVIAGVIVPTRIMGLEITEDDRIDIKNIINENRFVAPRGLIDDNTEAYSIFVAGLHCTLMGIKTGLFTHPIAFANRIRRAEDFIECAIFLSKTKKYKLDLNDKNCFALNGTHSMNYRFSKLSGFEQCEHGIVSNARCLSEGVDITIIDGIVFLDRKHSLPDIIQTVGRGFRLHNGKKWNTIILPIVIDRTEEGNPIFEDGFLAITRDLVANLIASDVYFQNIAEAEDYTIITNDDLRNGKDVRSLPTVGERRRLMGGRNAGDAEPRPRNSLEINMSDLTKKLKMVKILESDTTEAQKPEETLALKLVEYTENFKEHIKIALMESKPKNFKKYATYLLNPEVHIADFGVVASISEERSRLLLDDFFKEIEGPQKELATKIQQYETSKILGNG